MKTLGIVPARYASTRFPGKPLVMIGSKTMIERVYEQAGKALETVYVATDNALIEEAVIGFGGNVVRTSEKHQSGTDRCNEALEIIEKKTGTRFDVVINIQGDEPFIDPSQIESIVMPFNKPEVQIATLIKKFRDNEDVFNPNIPKVVLDISQNAIYFSRTPVPFIRGANKVEWKTHFNFLKHIGMYAYRSEVLKEISKLPQSNLEIAESLEQLRWIENGFKIKAVETFHDTISIDTPEDLQEVIRIFSPK